jgi:hypothetical protein
VLVLERERGGWATIYLALLVLMSFASSEFFLCKRLNLVNFFKVARNITSFSPAKSSDTPSAYGWYVPMRKIEVTERLHLVLKAIVEGDVALDDYDFIARPNVRIVEGSKWQRPWQLPRWIYSAFVFAAKDFELDWQRNRVPNWRVFRERHSDSMGRSIQDSCITNSNIVDRNTELFPIPRWNTTYFQNCSLGAYQLLPHQRGLLLDLLKGIVHRHSLLPSFASIVSDGHESEEVDYKFQPIRYFASLFVGIILMGYGLWYAQFRCENWGGFAWSVSSIFTGLYFFGLGINRLNL